MWCCERGTTMNATNKGPIAVPAFPPSWKIDCAKPLFPPEAKNEILDDSGWNMEEPIPTKTTATITILKLDAYANVTIPANVNSIPNICPKGFGCLSVYNPTTGCKIEAAS